MKIASVLGAVYKESMRNADELTTDRYDLKKIAMEDYDFLCEIYADRNVMKYISTGVCDREKTLQMHRQFLQHWEKNSFGAWVICDKDTQKKLGYIGFRLIENEPDVEFFGFLIQSAWNKGTAFEAGTACLQHAFDDLGFSQIYGVVDAQNQASHKWLKKLGFERVPEKDGIFHNSFLNYLRLTKIK